MKCHNCSKLIEVSNQKKRVFEPAFLPAIALDVRVYICDFCGHEQMNSHELARIETVLQQYRAEYPNVPAPAHIKRFRRALGLSQKDAGDVFGGGPNAFSRYERGHTKPPKSLGLIVYQYQRQASLIEAIHECRVILKQEKTLQSLTCCQES